MSETTLRDTFNAADENRTGAAFTDLRLGELVNKLILLSAATEAALVPAAHVTTLAAVPTQLFDVNVVTGTTTGHKKLIKGRTAPDGTIQPVPAVGQATWDGGLKIRTNVTDNAATVDVRYSKAADPVVSYLQRALGEQD
jgi:hypothetical protein